MRIRVGLSIIAASVMLISCGNNSKQNRAKADNKYGFEYITLPTIITDDVGASNYIAINFWNNYDFSDTTTVSIAETEQAMTDYLSAIGMADKAESHEGLRKLYRQAGADSLMLVRFAELGEKYLHDPNSPMRNEELFIVVMESLLEQPKYDETMRLRIRELYDMAMKNRMGTKAFDFAYTTINGKRSTLYSTKADYTLLFFNNPGCTACNEITEIILTSDNIVPLVKNGKLKILALYPDEDLTEWKDYAPNIPGEWINAHDPGTVIQNEQSYDLKAIPSLYLLDKEKNVIIKDAFIEQVDYYFRMLNQSIG